MAKTNDATLLPAAAWPSKTFPRPPMHQVLNQLAGFCKQIGYAKTLKALAKEAESNGMTIDESAIASQDGPLKLSLGDIYLDAFMNWPEEVEAEIMDVDKQAADSSSDDSSSDDSSESESSSDDSSSESESESSDEESESTAVPAKPAATVASKRKRDGSDSDSDSSSDDDSDSEESEAPAAKKSKIKEANSDSDSDSSEDEEEAPVSKKPKIKEANSEDESSEDNSSSSDESSDESSDSSDDEAESKADTSEDSSDDSSDSSSDVDDEPTPKQSKSKSTVDTASDSSKSSVTLAGSGTDDNGGMHPSRASRMAPAPVKSAQPAGDGKKKVEPFSRIPKNQYVDPRFGSNAYVSYDYADRAHQDLIVTKGKGFTKEKNKKKRGSYRGGTIDVAPKGIQFED